MCVSEGRQFFFISLAKLIFFYGMRLSSCKPTTNNHTHFDKARWFNKNFLVRRQKKKRIFMHEKSSIV